MSSTAKLDSHRRGRRTHSSVAVLMAVLGLFQPLLALPALLLPGTAAAQEAPAARTRTGGKNAKAAEQSNVMLNFVNAEIEGVARAIGAVMGRQMMVDPRVKGTITLYSEQPLTPREAYLNFLAALRGQGFTVVESGGMLKVVPEAEAKLQTGVVSAGAVQRSGDQVVTQIFKLQHENSNNMVAILRPLISPNNTINANPNNNSLVITDYADNLQRIAKIIAAMDMPSTTDLEIIPVKNAIAADIAPLVQKFADAPTQGAVGAAASQTAVLADPRSNSLLVRAGSPARLASIRALVDKLDQPYSVGLGGSGIHVVYLKNADATKLAQVLRAAFAGEARGGSGGGGGGASSPSYSGGAATSPNTTNTMGSTTAGGTAGTASQQATAPVQASAGPSTGGFIQADPATNSLIITASDALYRQLRAVIDQLDSRRAQIYVETMIVEMQADKAAEIGVQWQALIGEKGDKNGIVIGSTSNRTGNNLIDVNIAALSGNNPGLSPGLNLGVIHNYAGTYALGALAQFLQSKGDSNLLSTPNIIALDNEEAKITVGQNVPFVTGQYTNANTSSGSVNPFQTIERKDVGMTLRIKPQIGENGTVRMTIYQENSDVVGDTDTNPNGPTTTKNSIETSIVVDDGAVIVLGGQMRDRYGRGRDQVPLFGDIPLLGNLFRSESRAAQKNVLMVFLRPVVMRTQEAATAVTLDRYETIRALQKDTIPPTNYALPVNESPVLPPLQPPRVGGAPGPEMPLPATPMPSMKPAPRTDDGAGQGADPTAPARPVEAPPAR